MLIISCYKLVNFIITYCAVLGKAWLTVLHALYHKLKKFYEGTSYTVAVMREFRGGNSIGKGLNFLLPSPHWVQPVPPPPPSITAASKCLFTELFTVAESVVDPMKPMEKNYIVQPWNKVPLSITGKSRKDFKY